MKARSDGNVRLCTWSMNARSLCLTGQWRRDTVLQPADTRSATDTGPCLMGCRCSKKNTAGRPLGQSTVLVNTSTEQVILAWADRIEKHREHACMSEREKKAPREMQSQCAVGNYLATLKHTHDITDGKIIAKHSTHRAADFK